jgi:anti-sigma B factor antagonist
MAGSGLQIEQVGDVAVVRFGDCRSLDESSSHAVGQELNDLVEKEGHLKVLLNMADVVFLTSTALGKLVILHKKMKVAGGVLKLCALQGPIESIFQITHLNHLFEIYPNEAAALLAFAKRK